MLEPIFEIVKIKVERKKLPKKYQGTIVEEAITGPEVFAEIAIKFIGDEDREVFLVGCLNARNELQSLHRCHIGTLTASLVSVREVFKTAFIESAASIIVAHNHPNLSLKPSDDDLRITEQLESAGKLLDVPLVDHLIITDTNYVSLREKGYF